MRREVDRIGADGNVNSIAPIVLMSGSRDRVHVTTGLSTNGRLILVVLLRQRGPGPGSGSDYALPSVALPELDNASSADPRRRLAFGELMGSASVEQLDRWTQVAAESLQSPMGLILFLDAPRQASGCSPSTVAWATDERRSPVTHIFCQEVAGRGGPMAVDDARGQELLDAHGTAEELGMVAYAGAPIVVSDQALGALCVIQPDARAWRDAELRLLNKLASGLAYEIELCAAAEELIRSAARTKAQSHIHELIAGNQPLAQIMTAIVASIEAQVPELQGSIVTLDEGLLAGRAVKPLGLHCSWPLPINDGQGARLGTLEVRGRATPSDRDRGFLRDAARLAGIAVDAHRCRDRLVFATTHDTLTGLTKGAAAIHHLDDIVRRGSESASGVSVLFIDLDRLRAVNDSLGYEVGDHVIRQVAGRVRDCAAPDDLVARLGGEEFIIISVGDDDHAVDLARRVVEALRVPLTGLPPTHELSVTASVGMATITPDDVDGREAVCRADVAMAVAKSRGGNQHAISAPTDVAAPPRRLLIESALRHAIDRKELSLVFQPLQRFADRRLVAVEALVRWLHPDLGQIAPDEFIPIAEKTGQINQIGTWILHTACAALPTLADDYGHEVQLGVNVSAQQLRNPELQRTISDVLHAKGLSASRMYVEITETALLASDDITEQNVRALHALGIHIALDDFGTGYSSLAVLKAFPIEAIKIDRSFIEGLPEDHDNAAIVTALIGMAKSLGLKVVAEGVETPRQYAALRDLGCDLAQGYLVGRPVAAGTGTSGDAND